MQQASAKDRTEEFQKIVERLRRSQVPVSMHMHRLCCSTCLLAAMAVKLPEAISQSYALHQCSASSGQRNINGVMHAGSVNIVCICPKWCASSINPSLPSKSSTIAIKAV